MDARPMSRSEREDLQRLIKQRERVLKSAAALRSAELLADFDNQLAAEFRFDDDETWETAAAIAQEAVARAQTIVADRCEELGIPREFAPSLSVAWSARGYGNGVKARREELRRAAKTRITAMEQSAILRIETASVDGQTQLALAGMTSDAATQFVRGLPQVEDLMSRFSVAELIEGAKPPPSAQLIANRAQRHAHEATVALEDQTEGEDA